MDQKRIDEIRKRAEAATFWGPGDCQLERRLEVKVDDGRRWVWMPECSYLGDTNIQYAGCYENGGNDWEFCAHAREDVPALCDALEHERKVKQEIEMQRDEAAKTVAKFSKRIAELEESLKNAEIEGGWRLS
jgi:hypothetical protein